MPPILPLNRALRRDSPLLICILLVLGLQILAPGAMDVLRYDRAPVLAGQWWRLVSGHFIHLNWPHAVMDLAGLIALRLVFPQAPIWQGWRFAAAAVGFALGISLMFLALDPHLVWYVGLSGVLHALAAVIACTVWRDSRIQAALLSLGLIAKLYVEQIHGPSPLSVSMIGAPVVTDAHLYGAILGGVTGGAIVVWECCRARRGRRRNP